MPAMRLLATALLFTLCQNTYIYHIETSRVSYGMCKDTQKCITHKELPRYIAQHRQKATEAIQEEYRQLTNPRFPVQTIFQPPKIQTKITITQHDTRNVAVAIITEACQEYEVIENLYR